MEGFAFYALIGLLLLIPLEVFLLVIAAALARRRELVPKLAVPSQKQQERYGWEDLLKLSPERKPSRSRKAVIAAVIALLLLLVVLVPGWFLVSPSFQLNLSKQPVNDTTLTPTLEVNETAGRGIFSNLTFPSLNITAPKMNLSGVFVPLGASVRAVAFGLAAVVVAVLVLLLIIRRRKKLAVVTKARETSEKLIRKAGKEKKASSGAQHSFFSRFKEVRNYIAPVAIIFLLVAIAFLVYLLRDRIRTGFSGRLLSFAVSAKEFSLNYRLYILAGFVALLVLVFLLRHIAKRRQK